MLDQITADFIYLDFENEESDGEAEITINVASGDISGTVRDNEGNIFIMDLRVNSEGKSS